PAPGRADGLVRQSAGEVEAAGPCRDRGRAAPHVGGQDPKVPPQGARMTLLTPELFDSFASSTADVNEAEALPPVIYTSPEFYAFEKEAIFAHEWLCVGRADQVPEPGDWYATTIVDEPLIVVRGK